ncbi:MAG: hypothetical protein JXO22_00975 [Phycisphaerae bacterium]|nr:hypothetical protein [Phycisphaerae bacterium]
MMHTDYMRMEPVYRDRLRAAGLDRVESVLSHQDGLIVAWSRTTDSVYVPAADGGVGFYVKRYLYPTWHKRFRGMLRGTFFGTHRGKAEARALNVMRNLGIPAVRPVAHGWRRVGHFVAACFLITEEVPGAPNLTTFGQEVKVGERQLTFAQRRAMTYELADLVSAMHGKGFAHGRLFWRNLLVRFSVTGAPEFALLDAEPPKRIERFGQGGHWWLHDLAKLAVSAIPFTRRTDRVRFMRRYFNMSALSADAKTQIHEMDRLGQPWHRHEAQRIRMNARFERWTRLLASEMRARATPDAKGQG